MNKLLFPKIAWAILRVAEIELKIPDMQREYKIED